MRDRLLMFAGRLVWNRPWTVVLIALVAAIACSIYAGTSLILNANTDDLIGADRPFMADYRRLLNEFGDLEYLYVVVENQGDDHRAQQVVEQITQRLQTIPDLQGVYGWIDPTEQLRIATRAMPDGDLAAFAVASGGFDALLTADAGQVIRAAKEILSELMRGGMSMAPAQQQQLGAAAVFLLQVIAASRPDATSAAELAFLLPHHQQRQYFRSDTGRFYFITIMPAKDYGTLSVIEEPLRRIRDALDQVRAAHPDVSIGLTGKPVLQADEMATSNLDMTIAATIAFVLCAALFMISFGGIRLPLLAIFAFGCGSAWTYGCATAFIGQLNLLSIVFMLVLVGVGLDYGVHVLSRYREARRNGDDVRSAIMTAIVHAGRGNITGAITSSIVFFMALLTDFQGLRELGAIAGAGLLLCVVAMIVVLPALLTIAERRRTANASGSGSRTTARSEHARRDWLAFTVRAPGTVLAVAALSTLGLIAAPGQMHFEYNLLKLQAQGLESVEWERRILEDSAAASWFGAIIVPTQQQALDVIAKARQFPSIGAIRSVFDIIQPQTPQREQLRAQLHQRPSLGMPSSQTSASHDDWSADDLRSLAASLNIMGMGASERAPDEARLLSQLAANITSLAEQLAGPATAAAQVRSRFDQTVTAAAHSLRIMLEGDRMSLRAALPDALRNQYLSPSGLYLVMLHPAENVWEYEPMAQFIADLRAIDRNVTGAPITHFESLGDMTRAFFEMAIFAVIGIALMLWLDFRSIRHALLALIPTVIGLAWLIEIMALLGIWFNLANFFSVPILIGISVDGSVHLLHRYREAGRDDQRRFHLGGTRRAVIVTALTTAIGFGCIMLAHHQGLRSLGQVMAIGSMACLVATLIVLPAMLAWLDRRRS